MNQNSRLFLLSILILAFSSLACSLTTVLAPDPTASPIPPTPLPPTPTPNLPRTVRVTPDGSGDYPDLASAVASLAPGSTILLDEGEYILIDTLHITKTLTLQGAGMNMTYLSSSAPDGVLEFTGPGNLVLQGISFNYQGTNWAYVAQLTDASFNITDCRFVGGIRDAQSEIGGNGLYLKGSGNGRVADSRFVLNQHNGFAVAGQVNVLVENCGFSENSTHGLGFWEESQGTVRSCTANNNGAAAFIAADQAQATFEDNIVTDHTDSGAFYAYDSASITALGNEASGCAFCAFSTYGQSQGLFEDNLAHDNMQSGFCSFDQSLLTARNNESYANLLSGFASLDTSTATFENNKAHDNLDAGFSHSGDSFVTLTGNTVTRNTLSGIMIQNSAIVTATDNTIRNNTEAGFRAWDEAVLTAENNRVNLNGLSGFIILDRSSAEIKNNQIANNGASAITFFNQAMGNITGNQCSGNTNGGITIYDDAAPTIGTNNCQ